MGRLQAEAMAEANISLEMHLEWHLTANHYPPVPVRMVQPAIEAIDAANEGNWNKIIDLPDGVVWREGSPCAPAVAIIEELHLDTWIIESELD